MSDLFGTTRTSNPASTSDLFPSPTAAPGGFRSGPGPSVYYYVLLGVLVTLIVLAGLLTYRTYRLRRRYRTATQLAIARGDPVPPPTWWGTERIEDPWGLGFRRPARPRKWVRIPTLWDSVGEKEEAEEKEDDGWLGQPLTLQSGVPEVDAPPPMRQPVPVRGLTVGGFRRYWTPEERSALEMERDRPPTPPNPLEQEVNSGEPVRVAFVVQMPVMEQRREERDEDEVGWRPGMEIGVWEGVVQPETASSDEAGPGPNGDPSRDEQYRHSHGV